MDPKNFIHAIQLIDFTVIVGKESKKLIHTFSEMKTKKSEYFGRRSAKQHRLGNCAQKHK